MFHTLRQTCYESIEKKLNDHNLFVDYVDTTEKIEQGIHDATLLKAEENGVEIDFDQFYKYKKTKKLINSGKEVTMKCYPFREIYRENYLKVISALFLNPNRQTLHTRIDNGYVSLCDIAKMSHNELDTEKASIDANRRNESTRTLDVRTEIRDGKPILVPYEIQYSDEDPAWVEVPDSEIQCGKCKSLKVSIYQQQTRSADEPMTIFANCLACKSRWRM